MELEKKRGGGICILLLCILLIAAGGALSYKDLGRDYRHGVYRCEGGRMLAEPAVPDPGATAYISSGIGDILRSRPEIQQYMMLIPAAGFIQSEYLPAGTLLRDQSADLETIRGSMPAQLGWIDLVDLFRGHEGEKLYYATDPSLTGWGSRYAAHAALDSMEAQIPEGPDTCYLLSDSFQGSLALDGSLMDRFVSKKEERLEIYVPAEEAAYYRVDKSTEQRYGSLYDSAALKGSDQHKVFFGGERPLTEIYTTAVNGQSLLVVGDRSADSIVPMFVSSFETIILAHPSTCARTVEELVEEYKPTRILYLYDANTFMTDRSLLRALAHKK